jgi:hypothetical protein
LDNSGFVHIDREEALTSEVAVSDMLSVVRTAKADEQHKEIGRECEGFLD